MKSVLYYIRQTYIANGETAANICSVSIWEHIIDAKFEQIRIEFLGKKAGDLYWNVERLMNTIICKRSDNGLEVRFEKLVKEVEL